MGKMKKRKKKNNFYTEKSFQLVVSTPGFIAFNFVPFLPHLHGQWRTWQYFLHLNFSFLYFHPFQTHAVPHRDTKKREK